MTKANDYAYPFQDYDAPIYRCGLTKREYFAAIAMQGLLSLPLDSDLPSLELHRTIAALAVEHSNALINELNK